MTTAATRIRDAIAVRLDTLPGYVGDVRRTAVPQIQPDELPSLAVYILSERLEPDGDANQGAVAFVSEITIAISDVRGFGDRALLAGNVDAAVDAIEAKLLTDQSFTRISPLNGVDPYFEAVTGITRRRLFPQDGETYFAELRLEMTFVIRVEFDPVIPDDLERVRLRSKPLAAGDATPAVNVLVELDQA